MCGNEAALKSGAGAEWAGGLVVIVREEDVRSESSVWVNKWTRWFLSRLNRVELSGLEISFLHRIHFAFIYLDQTFETKIETNPSCSLLINQSIDAQTWLSLLLLINQNYDPARS